VPKSEKNENCLPSVGLEALGKECEYLKKKLDFFAECCIRALGKEGPLPSAPDLALSKEGAYVTGSLDVIHTLAHMPRPRPLQLRPWPRPRPPPPRPPQVLHPWGENKAMHVF
jgi:hypothetical protein